MGGLGSWEGLDDGKVGIGKLVDGKVGKVQTMGRLRR